MINQIFKNSSFKIRLISSIGIIVYFLIIFIFSWLADKNNGWSIVNIDYRHIFSWLLLCCLIPLFFLVSIEINQISHYRGKTFLLSMMFAIGINILLSSSIMICCQYDLLNFDNPTFVFLLTAFVGFIFFNLFIFIIMFYLKMKSYQILIILFMFNIFCLFILAFLYIAIIKSWSTLLIVLLLPILNDTFAYLGGSFFGKRKLAPLISPKKTVEGAIIGIIMAVGLCLIILVSYSFSSEEHNMLRNFLGVDFKKVSSNLFPNHFANKPLWWINSFVILLVLSIFSILGDLAFSTIKRRYYLKDFSTFIPGHGGILDRFDSHTFVFSLYFLISIGIGFFAKTIGVF